MLKELETEFNELQDQLVSELNLKGIAVYTILQAITKPPFEIRKTYETVIQNMLPDLEDRKSIHTLFFRLTPLFTFIDYELLEHLISKFGSDDLKKSMKSYACRIKLFKRDTTISDMIDYWPGPSSVDEEEKYFKRLRAKFNGEPKTYTLEKLDNFRRIFFSQMRLSEFVSVFILTSLESASSFYAEWLIPTVIVPDVVAAATLVEDSFYVEEGVALVWLDGNILYHAKTKSQLSVSQPVAQQLQGLVMKKELSTSLQQLPLPAGAEPVLGRPRSLSLPAMSIQTSTPAHQRPQKANLKQEQSASLQELPRELSTEQLFQASSRSRSLSLPELLPSTMSPKIPSQPMPLKWRSKSSSEQPYTLHPYPQGKSMYFYHVYFMHMYKYTCTINIISKSFHIQPNNRILLDENFK